MVRIVLNNQTQQSPYEKAVLDFQSCICLINDTEEIAISEFKQLEFNHPLLTQPILELVNGVYCYTYDDFTGLLNCAKYVYATLLQTQDPVSCRFKIAPSERFHRLKESYQIPFSLDYRKRAKEYIDINQLNSIISYFCNLDFQYQDSVLIDQEFSFKDLPVEINADRLFKTHTKLDPYLEGPDDFNKYELRYINRAIGFGVFARESIPKDEVVFVYCGMKLISDPKIQNFYFGPVDDALNMGTDARHRGNITRFINHALIEKPIKPGKKKADFLEANLCSCVYQLYGIAIIIFSATRDIVKNEQLLIDYGKEFFPDNSQLLFHKKGYPVNSRNKKIEDGYIQRVPMLKVMCKNGVKSALVPFYKRVFITVVVVTVFFILLKLK